MQNLLINRQIEIIENKKKYSQFDNLVYGYTMHWSWDRILDSVGAGKK